MYAEQREENIRIFASERKIDNGKSTKTDVHKSTFINPEKRQRAVLAPIKWKIKMICNFYNADILHMHRRYIILYYMYTG